MSSRVLIDDLADAIMEELNNYSDEVTEQIKKDVKKVANKCKKEIQANAPKKEGEYAAGWRAKTVFESPNDIRMVIYNEKKPGLTHLLENGHAKVNGGRVAGIPHIRPAELNAEKELLGIVKVAVR